MSKKKLIRTVNFSPQKLAFYALVGFAAAHNTRESRRRMLDDLAEATPKSSHPAPRQCSGAPRR